MPKLQVMVGPDRFHMEPCRVNDTHRPHEINTEHFVGRVLVRILDAPGAQEGEEGREYFKDRSRRFCIQIEGRFKKAWNGDDIHFGSDFDKFVDFPRAPFNAGMKVAKYIDPCTFYEEQPPSKRPYIMSPYCACMNVLCAWPAPSRAHEAVVVLRHTAKSSDPSPSRPSTPLIEPEKKGNAHDALVVPGAQNGAEDGDEEDIVPREGLSRSSSKRESEAAAKQKKKSSWFGGVTNVFGGGHKEERVLKRYWRFVGFKDEPRVRALLEAHHANLEAKSLINSPSIPQRKSSAESDTRSHAASGSSKGSGSSQEVQHGIAANHPTLRKLGTSVRGKLPGFSGDDPGTPYISGRHTSGDVSPLDSPSLAAQEQFFTAPEPAPQTLAVAGAAPALVQSPMRTSSPQPQSATAQNGNGQASHAEAPSMPALERITTAIRDEAEKSAKTDGLREEDFKLAGELQRKARVGEWKSQLEDELGHWRFDDPGTDMVEDNAFIFTHESLSVPKRRKYFANKEHREKFVYHPDVVYGASFFTDAFDFNTFNLSLGPVSLNVARFFKSMPVRYTLRAAGEEPVFCTISFQLVD
ncbi:unnamed protein product [Parajaminaea phylloscopi]